MSEPENQHQEALQVLNNYYTSLATKMAAEIVERREDFESPGFGSQPDDLMEKYARHIQQLGSVYSILRWKAAHGRSRKGRNPWASTTSGVLVAVGSFIQRKTYAPVCGWSWR